MNKLIITLIDREILSKLRVLTHNHIYQKAFNRISLLKKNQIEEIINFLDSDWTKKEEVFKCKYFKLLFYNLGFEVIPLELILDHRDYRELNKISHPELIAYDLNSNYILLFEEVNKLKNTILYKKDSINKILTLFNNFFYSENRRVDYLIVANDISIDFSHYDFKHRIMQKKTIIEMLKNVFNTKLLDINFKNDLQIRVIIGRLINDLKNSNQLDDFTTRD